MLGIDEARGMSFFKHDFTGSLLRPGGGLLDPVRGLKTPDKEDRRVLGVSQLGSRFCAARAEPLQLTTEASGGVVATNGGGGSEGSPSKDSSMELLSNSIMGSTGPAFATMGFTLVGKDK